MDDNSRTSQQSLCLKYGMQTTQTLSIAYLWFNRTRIIGFGIGIRRRANR